MVPRRKKVWQKTVESRGGVREQHYGRGVVTKLLFVWKDGVAGRTYAAETHGLPDSYAQRSLRGPECESRRRKEEKQGRCGAR